MNKVRFLSGARLFRQAIRLCLTACFFLTVSSVHATATFWTGPIVTFIHPVSTNLADMLTTNHVGVDASKNVWLTRGTQFPLYNIAAESGWNGVTPSNTLWSLASPTGLPPFPPITTAETNIYDTFANVVGHPGGFPGPGRSVGKTFYVKIITDNIILSLKLDAWGNNNGGSFTYERSSPAAVVTPPTPAISITNLPSGTVFVAPANVTIGANATVSSGTVTNVQFFTNNVPFKSVQSAPFIVSAGNLAAGAYALTAAATAAGISATSSVVNIIVDTPPVVTITNPLNNASFSAPVNLTIRAAATDSDGSVSNVQFLLGTTVLTNNNTSPFFAATNNLAAGTYSLSAIASDNNGVKATNTISINVVAPVAVSLGGTVKSSATNFQFSYPVNVGLTYVVERSTNLIFPAWTRLVTNIAASNPSVFVDTFATNTPGFYRVGRLPNP